MLEELQSIMISYSQDRLVTTLSILGQHGSAIALDGTASPGSPSGNEDAAATIHNIHTVKREHSLSHRLGHFIQLPKG